MSTHAFDRRTQRPVGVRLGLSPTLGVAGMGASRSRSPSHSCSRISWRSTVISSTACTRRPCSACGLVSLDRLRPRRRNQAALGVGGGTRRGLRGRAGGDGLAHEDATAHPDGLELIGAVLWRGVLYGVTDGSSVGVPDPRRLRRLRGKPTKPSLRRQARDRRRCADRLARDDRRLPRRLQRFPIRQDREAADRRRRVERPDPRDAQPGRRSDRTRRLARVCRVAQLRHGHVPATPRMRSEAELGQLPEHQESAGPTAKEVPCRVLRVVLVREGVV